MKKLIFKKANYLTAGGLSLATKNTVVIHPETQEEFRIEHTGQMTMIKMLAEHLHSISVVMKTILVLFVDQ